MEGLSTVDKAFDLLAELAHSCAPQGVSSLAKALGLPKTSVHRLVTTLARRGLLERDERRRYRIGAALVALGLSAVSGDPVVALARPVLEATAAELGETLFLAGPRGGSLRVLDKVEGSGFLRAAPRVGEAVPLHATAVGKLVLAYAPHAVALGREPLVPFTRATLTSHEALQAEVRRAVLRGWAESRGEWIPGLSVVAAPVFREDELVAAVALAAVTERVTALGVLPIAARLRAAAQRLEERLEVPPVRRRKSG